MRVTYCLSVLVRFSNPTIQAVNIELTDGPTASQYLRVENDGVTISIQFCDKDNDVKREINYSFKDVREYDCKGWVAPRAKCDRGQS